MHKVTSIGFLFLFLGSACNSESIALGPDVDMASDLSSAPDLAHVVCDTALGMPASLPSATGSAVWFTALADFNGDSKLDIAVTNAGTAIMEPFPGVADHTVSVMFGNGDGSFKAATNYPTGDGPIGVQAADVNGDGKPDLIVGNGGPNATRGSTLSVLLNNGDGTFAAQKTYATGTGPYGLVVVDLDGNGARDIAVVNVSDNTLSVLMGNGDGTFKPQTVIPVGSNPLSVTSGDFNKDGKVDLVVANNANGAGGSISVLLGKGDGTFNMGTLVATDPYAFSIAAGDLNKDGNLDLVVANTGVDAINVFMGTGTGTFGPKIRYLAGKYPISVGIADFDHDGAPDVLVANTGEDAIGVFLNNGDGTLAGMTLYDSLVGTRLAIGDVNGDGKPDVVTPGSSLLGGCP